MGMSGLCCFLRLFKIFQYSLGFVDFKLAILFLIFFLCLRILLSIILVYFNDTSKSKPWFDDECRQARKQFRCSKRKLKRNRTQALENDTKSLKKKYKRIMDKSIRKYFHPYLLIEKVYHLFVPD
jgi:hypothetical protein